MTANGEQWAAELDQLRAETHTVRVTTSAAQMASHRRALLVARLHKQGVPTRAMADALGVTPAAIRHLIYRVAAMPTPAPDPALTEMVDALREAQGGVLTGTRLDDVEAAS